MDNEVILLQTKKSELWKVNTSHQRLLITSNTNTRKQRETLWVSKSKLVSFLPETNKPQKDSGW